MFYNKPKNISYTQMCMWIDENVYKEDLSEDDKNKIFEYIYHISKMLAIKGKFFTKMFYYEDFAIFMASEIFMRLFNKKQFELNEDGEPKLSKIKSILNYIKSVISCRKIAFENTYYNQSFSPKEEYIDEQPEYTFSSLLNDSIDDLNLMEFESCLQDVCKTIKHHLRNIPYKNDKLLMNNIYISCLLSFLNSITLSNKDLARLSNIKTVEVADTFIDNCFIKEKNNFVILFHLPDHMKDYITILTKEIKHAIAKDLSIEFRTQITSNTGLQAFALSEINSLN